MSLACFLRRSLVRFFGSFYLYILSCRWLLRETYVRHHLQCQWVDSQKSQASLSHYPPSSALAEDVCHTPQTALGIRSTPHGLQTCVSFQLWRKDVVKMEWRLRAVVSLWWRSTVSAGWDSRLRHYLLSVNKRKGNIWNTFETSWA